MPVVRSWNKPPAAALATDRLEAAAPGVLFNLCHGSAGPK